MATARHTPLDEAWAAWVAGRKDAAIRACTAILEKDGAQVPTAQLLTEALVDAGRVGVAERAIGRLVEMFVDRGDLPRAVATSRLADRAGLDPKPHHRAIAAAFGKGSSRLADVAPAPPPLPVAAEIDAELKSAKGDDLLEVAEAALGAFLATPFEGDPSSQVPTLPLFSALPPPALEALLGCWELSEVAEGDAIVDEGAEGKEAYVVVRGSARAQRGAGDAVTVLAELGPGALFGEMALVSDAPRAASVVALEATQLLVARRDDLEALAKRTPEIGAQLSQFCRARMVSNLIRHSAILGAVEPAERDRLMARFETRSFKSGEQIVSRGVETEGLFLIASGAVNVTSEDEDGETLQIAQLGPGDVVGEISLVLRRPATADVVATHPTVALELRRDQFQEAIREHPGLLGELYELATKREDEMRTVVAQETLDVEEMVLL